MNSRTNDMPPSVFDAEAKYAQIGERVDNQGTRISNLERTVTEGFTSLNHALQRTSEEMRGNNSALANELRNNSKTPWAIIWSAIGVSFGIIAMLGAQSLGPIKEAVAESKLDIRFVSQNALSVASFQDFKSTYESNRVITRSENIDKFKAVNDAISKLETTYISRPELERVVTDHDHQIASIQRQIDKLSSGQYHAGQ